MTIQKIINNNIVSCLDNHNREIIVMGKGLGFGQKAGMTVPEDKIEKIFHMQDNTQSEKLTEILNSIPANYIQVTHEIIVAATELLQGKQLKDTVYLTLTDHISCAVERAKEGSSLNNALMWDIRRFYPRELQAGKRALEIIKEHLQIELEEEEAGFIALHFVNAQQDSSMNQTMEMTRFIENILKITKYTNQIEFDEESYLYGRFLSHLRFLAQRIFAHTALNGADEDFYRMICVQYKEGYRCVEKIVSYVKKEYDYEISEEEKSYLTVHIQRLTDAARGKNEEIQ